MGAKPTIEKYPDFLLQKCHKIYVITCEGNNYVKVGYTSRSIVTGIWKRYRSAYGKDQVIIRIFPCSKFKEDEDIHVVLHPQYGIPKKGREIYHKKYLNAILRFLEQWCSSTGFGPYDRENILYLRSVEVISEIIDGMEFLSL